MALMLVATLMSCEKSKHSQPASTDTNSATIPALADRIAFLETYLTFDRTYEQLEFHINYRNNGDGLVPGPSDWDIRLAAKVPPEDLPIWIEGLNPSTEEAQWLSGVTQKIDVSGVDKWYRDGGKVVGIDKKNAIVVYRINTFGE